MMFVLTLIVLSMLVSSASAKAMGKRESSHYLTRKDLELSEQLQKVPQTSNMPVSARLFEGDIVGIKDPKAYMEQLHAAMTQHTSNGHANAIISPLKKWPNAIIPYAINDQVNAAAREVVASAIKEIREKTCVKIVPRTSEDHYLSIEVGEGCDSFVGRIQSLPKQPLHLGSGCETHSIAVHELMHAVGFYHEHSRSDRDKYITVVSSNIDKDNLDQFDVLRLDEATDLNTTFDYDSVMLNELPTLQPKQSGKIIGQATGLSPNDVLKINLLYDCATNGVLSANGYKADSNVLCPTWKADRQCERNSAWMNKNCKKTCGQC